MNFNQSNLTIDVQNIILENVRAKEILSQKKKYERIRTPIKKCFELKIDILTLLKKNQISLKKGPGYYEKINDLVNVDLY